MSHITSALSYCIAKFKTIENIPRSQSFYLIQISLFQHLLPGLALPQKHSTSEGHASFFWLAESDAFKCGPACCSLSTRESSFSGTDLCHHSISSVNQHLMGTFRRVRLATVAQRGHSWVPCNKIHSLLPHFLCFFTFFSFYIYAIAYLFEILIALEKFN